MALRIHGMHGFFYKDACARALAHHDTKAEKPAWVNSEEILHYGGGVKVPFKGEAFDYGNNIRAYAKEAGCERAFDIVGFIPLYLRPQFCLGRGPFRWRGHPHTHESRWPPA